MYLHSGLFALTLSGFALRCVNARNGSRSLFAPWFCARANVTASEERAGENLAAPAQAVCTANLP